MCYVSAVCFYLVVVRAVLVVRACVLFNRRRLAVVRVLKWFSTLQARYFRVPAGVLLGGASCHAIMLARGSSELRLEEDIDVSGAKPEAGEDAPGPAMTEAAAEDNTPKKPKPQPKKASQAGRHKAGNSKATRMCAACGQKRPASEFALNQKVDMSCKRFLDNIYKQAKAQGPQALEWLAETKADPAKCRQMIESYGGYSALWILVSCVSYARFL